MPCLKKQERQCDLFPGGRDGNWFIIDHDFHRTEQPEFHDPPSRSLWQLTSPGQPN